MDFQNQVQNQDCLLDGIVTRAADGWLQYKGSVLILDYEAVGSRSHSHWVPKQIQAKEVYFPPTEHIEFPLARAAKQALLGMAEPEPRRSMTVLSRRVLYLTTLELMLTRLRESR